MTVHAHTTAAAQAGYTASSTKCSSCQMISIVCSFICCSLTYHPLHVCKYSSCVNNCTTYAASTGSEIGKIEAMPVFSEDCTFLKALILKESSI